MLKLVVFLVGVTIFQPAPQQSGQQTAQNQAPADPTSPTVIQPAPEREIRSPENPDSSRNKPEWWGPETAPDWIQIIVTIAVGWIAYRAFTNERETVRLTQRADVLVDRLQFRPKRPPPLSANGEIVVHFKNFGMTRASNVWITGTFEIPGVPHKADIASTPLDAGVIPRDGEQPFGFAALGEIYTEDVIQKVNSGQLPLYMETTVEYTDVFGVSHRTFNRSRFAFDNFHGERHEAD